MRKIVALLALVIAFATACEEKFEDRSLLEKPALEKYLADNNITTAPTASGLYYINLESVPEGRQVADEKYVNIRYSMWLTNGKRIIKAQEIYHLMGNGNYIGTQDVFKGLNEALLLMRQGERAKVIIPSELAYGEIETSSVPSFSTLVYEIEVLSSDLKGDETEFINEYLDENQGFILESDTIYFKKTLEVEGNPDQVDNPDDDNPYPEYNQYISVNYTGYFIGGDVFDRGTDFDVTIGDKSLVVGFDKACRLLKVGEKATVIIPYEFAYGTSGKDNIPPFTPLMYDLERVD